MPKITTNMVSIMPLSISIIKFKIESIILIIDKIYL